MRNLLAGLVMAIVGVGLALLASPRRGELVARWAWISSLCLALLSLLLLGQVGQATSVRLAWIPGVEPASLGLGAPGVYLAVMAFWALALVHVSHAERPPPESGVYYWPGLSYLLCALVPFNDITFAVGKYYRIARLSDNVPEFLLAGG